MFEEIKQHNALVRDQIYKGFAGGEELLEKAHQVGDIHPNGKWVWTEYAPGKFDWRVLKGQAKSAPSASSASSSTQKQDEKKEVKAEKSKKADLPFTGLTKYSQVIDYAKMIDIDGADFEEIDSEFGDKDSKAFRLNYNGGLKLDVDFLNNSEYIYIFRDKNDNPLYEIHSTRNTNTTDWSVMLNPRKWANLVKSNISKHISQRKAEQTKYYNLYDRTNKSSYYEKYLNAKYDIERLNRSLDKVNKILQLS